MMLSLAVALLAVAPASSHLSLLASEAPTLPSAARVLTQATPEAPPRSVSPELEARIQDMTRRIKALNARIDAVDTRWPGSSVLMATVGVILGGLAAIAVPLSLLGSLLGIENNALLPIAVVGGAGLTLLVLGYTSGESATRPARAERDELLRERDALRLELKELKQERKRQQGLAERPFAHVTLVSLAF
jgi:hypothetical protein